MSEEPEAKTASPDHDHRGKFAVGNKARPYSPTAVAQEKAANEHSDVGSILRTAMFKAIGGKRELEDFLGKLQTKDPGTYAKLMVQLEPKDTQGKPQRQIVFVEVCQGQPPTEWTLPDVGDTDDATKADDVAQVTEDASLGQGI